MMKALDFLRGKNMIAEDMSEFVIVGNFGKINLTELLEEFVKTNSELADINDAVSSMSENELERSNWGFINYECEHVWNARYDNNNNNNAIGKICVKCKIEK